MWGEFLNANVAMSYPYSKERRMNDPVFVEGAGTIESNGQIEPDTHDASIMEPFSTDVLESHRTYLKKVA